ncbi:MAG: DNA-directed RNA polymerase subunit alpha C-terminal domain-containing protein [bacterium]
MTLCIKYYSIANGKVPKQITQTKQKNMQPRMNRRDQAELIELITTWNKKKRGMIPRGHKLIIMLDVEPITPSSIVEVRVVGKATSTRTSRKTPEKIPAKKLNGNIKAIMEMPLINLDLRTSVFNVLSGLKIKTIGNLYIWVSARSEELLLTPRFGHGSLQECREKLKAQGFELV